MKKEGDGCHKVTVWILREKQRSSREQQMELELRLQHDSTRPVHVLYLPTAMLHHLNVLRMNSMRFVHILLLQL
jgi:hypothetical protein